MDNVCFVLKTNKKIVELEPGDVVLSEIKAGNLNLIISQSYLGEPDGFDQMLSHPLPLNEVIKIFKRRGFEIRTI